MIETIEETKTDSLGTQLKKRREALNLSIEEVAQKTHLKKNHIDSFENDVFTLKNIPPAFVRGYIRNYVRFLRLPESLILQAGYGEQDEGNVTKRNVPMQVSNPKSQRRWLKFLTWLILLCAIGMTLAWWWQEHQKDERNRAEIVGSSAFTTQSPTTASPQPVVSSQDNASGADAVPTAEAQNATLETETKSVLVSSEAENPVTEAPLATDTPAPTAIDTLNRVAQADNPDKASSVPETEEALAKSNGLLRIEVTKNESWVSVKSVKHKRSLVEKVYAAGDVLTFDDEQDQYHLVIGAPVNVKVYYKGQQVPLKVDGRVVRIKLPQ